MRTINRNRLKLAVLATALLTTLRVPAAHAGGIVDQGYADMLHARADVNADGLDDYCRFVGDHPNIFLSCQLAVSEGDYGSPYGFDSIKGIDRGYSHLPSFLHDVNNDKRADFCRYVGDAASPYLACNLAQTTGFSPQQYTRPYDAAPKGRRRTNYTTRAFGQLVCTVPDGGTRLLMGLPNVPVRIGTSGRGRTDGAGLFNIAVGLRNPSARLKIPYDAAIFGGKKPGSAADVQTRLQVMNEWHNTRSDEVDRSGTVNETVLDLGPIQLDTQDCELWRLGVKMLKDFHDVREASPPAGILRIKRWAGVFVGTPHASYDYLAIPTDVLDEYPGLGRREEVMFHEFGHTIRHAADGSGTHFAGDVIGYGYARTHGDEITNVQFAFNEGWAQYWSAARRRTGAFGTKYTPDNRDWNENLVAKKLLELAAPSDVGDRVMVEVLEDNPGVIHSLQEFEVKLAERLGKEAPPAPASCPPLYTDDGLTCRRDASVVAKPSYGRGVGSAPGSCGGGFERNGALCYPGCRAGYYGVGPVCWQSCPAGYTDDGLTCRRDDTRIFGKSSYGRGVGSVPSSCAGGEEYDWGLCYPACGDGYYGVGPVCWESCPPGYSDDGLTCRGGWHIFWKGSYGRGVGSVPNSCAWGEENDWGLCYPVCGSGYDGVGPVCWQICPAGWSDDGATCRTGGVHIFGKDSYGRGVGSGMSCAPDQEYDAGLCYPPCSAGYHGVGPVCWGTCEPGYDDHGGTCYRGTSIITKY